MPVTRIYSVNVKGTLHLVEAKSPSQAISHVTLPGVLWASARAFKGISPGMLPPP